MKASDTFEGTPEDADSRRELSQAQVPEVDSDLRKAIQLELWELRTTEPGGEVESPDGLDSDTVRAATLLNRVFARPSPPDAAQRPEKIGRFRILAMLGAGRFGVVWRAFDPSGEREIALKVIHQSQMFDPAHRRRFLRECALAARLDHPAVVPMYEAGTVDGMPYLVMPVCDGQTLDKWFATQSKPVSPQVAAEIAMQMADAADYGHQHGVLHRDLKPGNVIINRSSRTGQSSSVTVRILDFGLAIPVDVSLRDTRGSLIAGTPVYMSPEQAECRTEEIGVASDIFAIGAILYELLTGSPPFDAASLPAVIERLQSETAASVRRFRVDVSVDLDAICMKCLANDPRSRYASGKELAADLKRFLTEQPVTARPIGRIRRVMSWCSLRRGQQQLALTAVVINFVIMLWSIASLPVALAEIPKGEVSVQTLLPILGPLFSFIIPLHSLLIWLSMRIRQLQNIRRNSLLAMILSALTLCYAFSVLLGISPAAPSPAYAENPFARNVAFTLVATGFAMLSGIYAALLGTAAKRTRISQSVGIVSTDFGHQANQSIAKPVDESHRD
ncbi:MAG: serine/threonine protein kinase [Planctomyces sp.]|nr:serine/threonine protein kinase [Planctomyces sp.]